LSCSRYRQLISRYVDDEVTPRQRADLLAHVQSCHDCAAWLARARQTDVLLKGVADTGPSDRVRDAIINQVRARSSKPEATMPSLSVARPAHRFGAVRLSTAGLLLRFNPSPWHFALVFAASLLTIVGLAYYLNVLPPIWGYDKLGFEYQPDSGQAVDTTPIPIPAISSGASGVGGPVAVPNLVSILPADKSQAVPLDAPLRVRFDQPMDRATVESALKIDPPVAGTFSWDADNEVRFAPDAPGYLRGITYTVTLSETADSMAGTPIKSDSTWSFSTQAAHTAASSRQDGATIAPTSTFSLQFDAPMQKVDAAQIVSLHRLAPDKNVPFTGAWGADGRTLAIQPGSALPEGYYYLLVQSGAATVAGDSLGRAFEFDYRVQSPGPRLLLSGDRVLLAGQGSAVPVRYALESSNSTTLDGLNLDVYALPAEWLSALGAQANPAGPLPNGIIGASKLVKQLQPASPVGTPLVGAQGTLQVTGLTAGIYLLVAAARAPEAVAGDWKLLIVSDRALALTGSNLPIWVTNDVGRPWNSAEISLYSPTGALLEKGNADGAGLWLPTSASKGASLALARDPWGNVAAALVDPQTTWGHNPQCALSQGSQNAGESLPTARCSLPASLVTDLPSYRLGDTVNFHLQLTSGQGDQDVSVSLLTPAGAAIETLTLKTDGVGSVGGMFPLSLDAQPGSYTIRAQSAGAAHDFPLVVAASPLDTLSVYILPSAEGAYTSTAITRTVSVLGPSGDPAAGAVVTATLAIRGDSWTSSPLTAVTGDDGRATFVVPMPSWLASYNDPGLYLQVSAESGSLHGSDTLYLDFMPQQSALSGLTQLVSPGLNVAVVARPSPDGNFSLRMVLVDQHAPYGDILLQAVSPAGERLSYSLDMARLLDATLSIPHKFGGGRLEVRAAGKPGVRTMPLMPLQSPELTLQVSVPYSVTAGANLQVGLELSGTGALGPGGSASIWLRRVSGDSSPLSLAWQPALSLDMSGTVTTSLQAPIIPGLWYVMAGAATPAGAQTVSWGVLRVMPGPWVQLPPAIQASAGDQPTFSVAIFNPTSDHLLTSLRTLAAGQVQVLGDDVQAVDVDAGSWSRLYWSAQCEKAGAGHIVFSFMPSSGVGGSWPLDMAAGPNSNATISYTAGVLNDERNVGVAVPWGLSGDSIKLEIRASTSLLPALAGIATDVQDGPVQATGGVSMAAARLSAPASVASAYTHLSATLPDNLHLSGVAYSLLLQQIYSAQHTDGGWSYTLDGTGVSSLRETAEVLLAFHRWQSYSANANLPAPDQAVINRALDYVSDKVARPIPAGQTTDMLDARVYSLYVLSLYRSVPLETVRSMLAYTASGLDDQGLSQDGQAWLALALWQAGNSSDAIALLDHLLLAGQDSSIQPSAPLLEALVIGEQSLPANAYRSRDVPDYVAIARRSVRALMEARQGSGWQTPTMTADALWALSRYASAAGEYPQASAPPPILSLGDRPVQADGLPGNPGTISVVLSGAELKPGTNWLKLKTPDSNQTLYYSLTLIATK
jgi:hypothetical protein